MAAIFQGKSAISIAATLRVGLIQVLGRYVAIYETRDRPVRTGLPCTSSAVYGRRALVRLGAKCRGTHLAHGWPASWLGVRIWR